MKNSPYLRYVMGIALWLSSLANAQYPYTQSSQVFIDSSRDNRPVKVEIWQPKTEKRAPLVLLSHGTGGNRISLSWIANNLTQEGYLVMAFDHYGNTFDNPIPKYFVSYWERPLDVTFLLNQLQKDEQFNQKIDFNKVAIIGFSLGGYTALALAGAEIDCKKFHDFSLRPENKSLLSIPEMGDLSTYVQQISCEDVPKSLKDNRIKCFMALAPALGFFSKSEPLDGHSVFIIGAENDQITPTPLNAERYAK